VTLPGAPNGERSRPGHRVRVMVALPDDEGKSRDAAIDRYATPGARTTSGDERIATLMRSRNFA
jgi:hypothetical protein